MRKMWKKGFVCFVLLLLPMANAFELFNDNPPAFSAEDLRAPEYVEFNYKIQEPPEPSQPIFPIVNCKIQPIIIGEVYASFGGTAKIYIINNSPTDFQWPSSDLYIINISIVWHNSIKTTRVVGKYANAGEKTYLGIWNFKTPSLPGKYIYHFELTVFAKDMQSSAWAGPKNISFRESEIEVIPLAKDFRNVLVKNEKEIYHEINLLARPGTKVREVLGRLEGSKGYTSFLLLSLFEFVANNIEYAHEPEGIDHWQSPEETLSKGSGDCEDFAILLCSLVTAAGGTARFCYTHDHAFAVVYVGKEPVSAEHAFASFYGHNMSFVFLRDEFGYWAVADPAGAPYLGGLPVGGIPSSYSNQTWFWHLNTTELGVIDITLKDYTPFSHYLPYLYASLLIAFSAITLSLLYLTSLAKCTECGKRVRAKAMLRCWLCGAPYHLSCYQNLYFCKRCNAWLHPAQSTEQKNQA